MGGIPPHPHTEDHQYGDKQGKGEGFHGILQATGARAYDEGWLNIRVSQS
jgi:hypothetical protein